MSALLTGGSPCAAAPSWDPMALALPSFPIVSDQ
jgi:hypothetical protein